MRLNRTRTNHGPLGSAQPQRALTRSHREVFSPLGPFAVALLRHLFGAIRVWAQLGLRAPRGQKRTYEWLCRISHQSCRLQLAISG